MVRCPLRLVSVVVAVLFGVVLPSLGWAQPAADAPHSGAVEVRLGDSVVALNGPWKFQVGDSPLDPLTHQPVWAQPGFDDSKWETVDLTPPEGSLDPISGLSGYVTGWAKRGHQGYWGYGWYRIRVRVESRPGVNLAIAGPANVDDAYQAFDNAKLVGAFGDFSKARPVIYFTQPVMFPVDSGSGERVLAFRIWMEANTLLQGNEQGGFHSAPLLGEARAVAAQHQGHWLELVRAYFLSPVQAIIFALLGIVACSLMLFDRSDRVYLWIALVLLTTAMNNIITTVASYTQWVGALDATIFGDVVVLPLVYTGWVMVWRVWFRLRKPTWLPDLLGVLVLLLMVSNALGDNIYYELVPLNVAHLFHLLSVWVRITLALLVVANVFIGIREQGLEGWIVLPTSLLGAIGGFRTELSEMHITVSWVILGSTVTTSQIANILLVATLAILLLRRLRASIRTQRQMALDVRQAQEVQQVILPEGKTKLPGFTIESEYHPAREVGGDFFQILPHKTDGSLLIVAGDVTGKGLKAGMLVALLVGAIRSTAELNPDPEFVLRALNRRLLGRGDAQATCLVLRITSEGQAKLANAGHMPPYLNGEALPMEGALPLGMVEGAEFSVMRFQVNEGDRLLLLSDGVVEATNADGKLFGFERVHELVSKASAAAEVAAAAQAFGQEDDISVISVTRMKELEYANTWAPQVGI